MNPDCQQLRDAMHGGDFATAAAVAAKAEASDPKLMRRFQAALAIAQGDSAGALSRLEGDDHPQALYFRCVAQANLQDFEGAWKTCEAISARDPNFPGLDDLRKNCAGAANALGKSTPLPREAFSPDPHDGDVPTLRAAAMEFYNGRMADGNKILRDALPQNAHPIQAIGRIVPRWDGRPVDRLFIGGFLGLGDTLQYVRFIRYARPAARHVTLAVPSPLVRLLADCGADDVVSKDRSGEALQRADAAVACYWYLPAVLARDDYGEAPYLHADSALEPSRALRIGLCWTSSPIGAVERAASLADFEPLRTLRGIEWHSLVPGAGSEWMRIHRPADFLDTATVAAGLDLIVTVDTAVAHLAGAMGKPTWLMLPEAADWRWGTGEFSTPWYPTARLFRRRVGESWHALLCRARNVLDAKRQTMLEARRRKG